MHGQDLSSPAPFWENNHGPLEQEGLDIAGKGAVTANPSLQKNRFLWECRKSFVTEEHPSPEDKTRSSATWSDLNKSLLRMLDETNEDVHGYPRTVLYSRWQSVVEEYSRRLLTNKIDRLSAISGLAVKFSQFVQSSAYLAGIWKEDLTRALCWIPYSSDRTPAQEWPPKAIYPEIPSWSWAAFDGSIVHFGDDSPRCTAHVEEGVNSPVTHKQGVDPFGSVAGGSICLSAMALEVSASEEDCRPAFNTYQPAENVIEVSNPDRFELVFSGNPRQRHQDPGATGITISRRPAGSASTTDFRTKNIPA